MTFAGSFGNSIRNGFCTISTTAQDFGGELSAGTEYRGVGVGVDLLRLAQRLTCNREPSPGYDPSFTGGQCPGIQYNVFFRVTYNNQGQGPFVFNDGPLPVYGPIFGLSSATIGNDVRVFVDASNMAGTDPQQYLAVNFTGGASSGFEVLSLEFTSVNRADGQPDNCGNPPANVPPSTPGSRTTNNDFTYVDNGGDTINITTLVTFGDINLGINGDLNIPFRVTIDDILPFTFNGKLDLSTGDVTYNPGNPNYNPSGEPNADGYGVEDPDDALPDVPDDVIAPNADDIEPSTRRVIRGVFVTTVSSSSNVTVLDQDSQPDIIIPNLGYVNFAIAVRNRVAWSSDIPVKNHKFFAECPWVGGAIDVKGTPRQGIEFVLSPVYSNEEEAQTFD
jgi:hypothetical protein